MEWAVQSHPGSALRFSQPLSGLLAHPSFAALFHAAAIPGIRPSELSPRRNRAPLSGSLAPLQSSTACWDASRRPYHQRFHRRPGVRRIGARWPGSPPGYELPFLGHDHITVRRCDHGQLLVALGPRRRARPVSAASPASKPLVPPANPFTSDVSCPTPHGRCSPGLQPLQSFHLRPLGALGPTRRLPESVRTRGPGTLPPTKAQPRRATCRE